MLKKSILNLLYSRNSTRLTLKVQSSQALRYIATQVQDEVYCNVPLRVVVFI